MPLTVRVDVKTERLLQRLARKRRLTKSEVIRDAIGRLARQVEAQEATGRPYEKIQDLIGTGRGVSPHLSERTAQLFRRLLSARRLSKPLGSDSH